MSSELFPIAAGIALGLFVALLRPGLPRWAGAGLAVALGVVATMISGEFEIGWEFLLIDIPLVAGSAVATAVLVRLVRRRTAGT
ncbi:hypothetical protein ACFV29_36965 [Streptomyces sp. NPDC059690]|uniref:hypothetical protein n=1 Tax=Streptomyces sp. NPDC059690 TaxID=3346907 RepID=UPI003695F87D